jgi:hypothetical protein
MGKAMSGGSHHTIHDGQGDAMPCHCPACTSPFVARRREMTRYADGSTTYAVTEVIDLATRRDAILARARAE